MTISDDHRREMMKKRLLGILFSFALMMGMMPALGVSQTAYAESAKLYVGTQEVDLSKDNSGTGWSYAVTGNTLTLTGATITEGYSANSYGIYYSGSATLNVVLVGDNNIKAPQGSYKLTYGIYSENGITISGDGSLSTDVDHDGIYAQNVTVKGGTINASGHTGINVSSTGTVSIEGGSVTLIQCSDGIFCKDLSISGGTVNISQAGEAFEAGQDVIISGGTVTASGATAIWAGRNIEISGGSVEATGTVAGLKTNNNDGDIKISGGSVTASGPTAIRADRNVIISGGTVEATATGDNGDAISAGNRVELNGGSVTASGGDGGHGIDASKGVQLGDSVKVWAGSSATDAKDVTETFVNDHDQRWVQTETATLWVAGIPVTSRNASDILGKIDEGATASYDYSTETLTLNNYSYESKGHVFGPDKKLYAAIYADQDLSIQLVGKNTVKCTEQEGSAGSGIYSAGKALTISGSGTLTATGYGQSGIGIQTHEKDITINGGTVTASGHNGLSVTGGKIKVNGGIVTVIGNGDKGISSDKDSIVVADKMGINAGDSKETAIAVAKKDFVDDHPQHWVQISEAYPLWVRGIRVMVSNRDDVLADGKVSYDPETNTLKLDGADITADSEHKYSDAAIYYEEEDKVLIIDAAKASTVTGPDAEMGSGIYLQAGNLTSRGSLSVTGAYCGINCFGDNITVNGKLTATGKEIGIYLGSGDVTVNSGADLTAVGNGLAGIAVNDGNGSVTIKRDAKVSAVGGAAGAIDAIVKNAITGTAWTDKVGTTGETAIEVNANRELGDTYKKVQFPASQYTITYDLSGGTLDGQTGIVTKKVDAGTVITLPAPVRDGYTFDYWEGSRYNAGDKYTVTADHTFTAVWKAADNGGGKKGGTNTGDGNSLGAWVVLLIAALTGTTGMAFARKRKGE